MTLEAAADVRVSGPSSAKALSVRVREDGIAIVTYDVPGESVNTLKASFADEFEDLIAKIEIDGAIRAAVLVSGKPDSFIVGADIEMLKAATTAREGELLSRAGHVALARLASSKKPVVAAIHGPALGGGFEVALACTARVLSDDKKTVLGFPEVQLGLLPGADGLQRLADKAGLEVALDYGLTGKNMRPSKAFDLGVADDVVARPILEQVAIELALALSSGAASGPASSEKNAPRPARGLRKKKPTLSNELTRVALEKTPVGRAILFQKARSTTLEKTHGHYPAPAAIIDVLKTYSAHGLSASQDVEARAFGDLAVTPVAKNLIHLFQAQTALKKDKGVDETDVKPRPVQSIFVLGAGLMGAGIAYVTSAVADLHVRMKDRDDASISRGLASIGEIFDDRVKKKQLTRLERGQKLALITTAIDDSGLKSADLVVEAVFEDLAVKRQVLREVEERGRPDVIFASNTSAIPIAKIAESARRPENVVGMHYFSPVHKMPLLEIVRADRTDAAVVATAVQVGKKQGKTVIVVRDGVGFYTTRVLAPYLNEASFLLAEGAAVDAIDEALVEWGWPVGPLTLVDEIGIDVAAHVGRAMHEGFGDRLAPPPLIERIVEEGRKGRKNEKGFYLYERDAGRGKSKEVDTTIYRTLGLGTPSHAARISAEEIQWRCSLQFVNEAMHAFGDRIVKSARDGDVGAVYGLGFPPFRGGPFRFVDSLGAADVVRRMRQYEQSHGQRWSPAPALLELERANRRFYA
jgi:3-hydroxyacyl-CoA dehydrogenase/enoyl-CoA hydratase/3-hydroxybutyryl-CoA epimerase